MAYEKPTDYKEVADRLADLKAIHPDARLRPHNPDEPFRVVTLGDKTFLVYTAACYKDENDTLPAIACAWEPFPGRTPYTRDSELMNAETSAWGRAIIAALRSESKLIASAEEVRNRRADQEADAARGPASQPSRRDQHSTVRRAPTSQDAPRADTETGETPPAPRADGITAAQTKAIYAIAKQKKLDPAHFVVPRGDVKPKVEELSKKEASEVIQALNDYDPEKTAARVAEAFGAGEEPF